MVYQALIYGLCGGSLFLLSLLLMFNLPKVNKQANLFLGICSFFLSCVFIQLLLDAVNAEEQTPLLFFLEFGRWAILPCFFVALNLYISPEKPYTHYLIHFLPTLFLFPILTGNYTLPAFGVYVIRYFLYFQLLLYAVWSNFLLKQHRLSVEKFTSQAGNIDLNWIQKLLGILFLLGVLSFSGRFFPLFSPIVDALYLLCIVQYSYYALSQTAIYPVSNNQVPVIKEAVISKDKERLTADQVSLFKERLLEMMKQDQPYLDPTINLPILAEQVGLSVHELSYVLNTGIGLSFYQFINGYRIRHARQLLENTANEDYSIYEISIRSGFNSKTTFYTAFKQEVGMTPKHYLQQIQQ
ncbi:AraC family transcriptional regulator [Sphingobacterium wenxiniae]|uniref:AraC-type DNA-binding protein n=1 Tax=Sphingobacterium wenxiniae TaxID=683125 RepID=A0A1I6S574_9SPHI|nr:helix-turn-helix domain-containing protein [Sphingobacterium wenxiniae]SFS72082.1 AraC-type DNA-binding protein [Sphingobacterium wenxiniae]